MMTNEKVQATFKDCLTAYFQTGTWDNPATSAYLDGEADLRWEETKAQLDAKITADHDIHMVFGQFVTECPDCACDPESPGIPQDEFLFLVESLAPGELSEWFGK